MPRVHPSSRGLQGGLVGHDYEDWSDQRCGVWPGCCQRNIGACQNCWLLIILLSLLLLTILLPSSFVLFAYDEVGFIKYTVNNQLDTSRVYTFGRYYLGPAYVGVKFPSNYQRVDSSLAVFTEDGQEFIVNMVTFYLLDVDRLADIYREFGSAGISRQVEIRLSSTIKAISPSFSLDQYIYNRPDITEGFYSGFDDFIGVRDDLASIGIIIERDKFWMGEVQIPEQILSLNLLAAVQSEVNIKQENEREAILVAVETTKLEAKTLANITGIHAEADAKVIEIDAEVNVDLRIIEAVAEGTIHKSLTEAEAEHINLVSKADGLGLASFFQRTNITNMTTKAAYIQYFALYDKHQETIGRDFESQMAHVQLTYPVEEEEEVTVENSNSSAGMQKQVPQHWNAAMDNKPHWTMASTLLLTFCVLILV